MNMEYKPNIKIENKPSEENITKEKINQAKESLDSTIKELNDSMGQVEKSSPERVKKIINYLKENSGNIIRPIITAIFSSSAILMVVNQMQQDQRDLDLTTFIIAAASGVLISAGMEITLHSLLPKKENAVDSLDNKFKQA